MYCKVCGNPMKDGDARCTVCGTAAEQPSEWADKKPNTAENLIRKDGEPAAQEPIPAIVDAEVQADNGLTLEEELFGPAPKEAPGNYFGAQGKKEASANGEEPEFSWNVYDFPKPKKTENIAFDWGEGDPKPIVPPDDKNDIEFESFKTKEFNLSDFVPTKELTEASEEADQLFSFDGKNEEFQKLLDREYERLKNENPISPDNPSLLQRMELWSEEHANGPARPHNLIAVEDETIEKDRFTAAPEPTVEKQDQEPIPVYITGMSTETAATLRAMNELSPEVMNARAKLEAAIFAAGTESAAETAEPVVIVAAPTPETVETEPEAVEETLETAETIPEEAEPEAAEEALAPEAFETPVEVPAAELPEAAQPPLPPLWFEQNEEEEEKEKKLKKEKKDKKEMKEKEPAKKGSVVARIFLILVIIILLAEITMLGIKYFAPESDAAATVAKVQTVIVDTYANATDRISEFFSGLGTDKSKDSDATDVKKPDTDKTPAVVDKTPAVVDTKPAADKNTLIKAAAASNENIKKVEANPDLSYKSGRDYGLTDINHSVPLTNNVWQMTSSGQPVLYDQSIVTTLIAFDSQWTDYVNGGSDAAIDLTKPGSSAYRDASSYSKVGKIKETFDLLQIGEIRKGSSGYYVWTYESITKTESGTTTQANYHWIYYLEPVDGAMKIVSYTKY